VFVRVPGDVNDKHKEITSMVCTTTGYLQSGSQTGSP